MIIDEELFEKLFKQAQESPRLRVNYDLRNSEDDTSQRMLNVLQIGTMIPIHRHQESSESIFILFGKVDEIFYDQNGNETDRFHLDPLIGKHGIQVPAGQWHTLEVIKPAVIFESKDRKYQSGRKENIMEK